MSKARSLSAFISDPAIDASEIGSNAVTTDKILDSAVTHTKLHTNMDLTSKTVTFADNHISGNKIHGGVISDFASIGIDDNASSTAITIDSSGKVGIGVTNPLAKLHVSGQTSFGPAGQSYAVLDVLPGTAAVGQTTIVRAYNSNNLQLTTYNGSGYNDGIVVSVAGNVGIGTVSPSANLEINPGSGGSELKITSTDNGGNNVRLIQGYNTYLNASNNVYMSAGGNTDMFNLVNGSVGIGTTSPDLKLHVDGSNGYPAASGSTPVGHIAIRAKNESSTHGAHIGVADASPWGTWIQAQDASNLATSYPLLLNPNGGNVGIGTNNPATTLQVAGNMLSQKVFVGDYNSNGTSARQVIGWYQISGNSNTTYRHLRTTLWGGGSPNGNFDYIMGGFHIQSYRYVQSAGQSDAWITFHNWSGSVQNGYNYVYYGNWDAGSYAYVDSTGYVTLRVSNGVYHAHHIDLHQFPIYPVRDIRVSAVIDSSSATI